MASCFLSCQPRQSIRCGAILCRGDHNLAYSNYPAYAAKWLPILSLYLICREAMKTKTLYLYTIFDQRRLDIIDQVEHGRSPQQVTHLPPVWDLLLPLA